MESKGDSDDLCGSVFPNPSSESKQEPMVQSSPSDPELDTTASSGQQCIELMEEDDDVKHRSNSHLDIIEKGPSHIDVPVNESAVCDEDMELTHKNAQGYQSLVHQQVKEDGIQSASLGSNPCSTVSPMSPTDQASMSLIPDDSNQNGISIIKPAGEQQLQCQPEVQSSIEAVVEMLLENSRHLPGFTQIIEQATHGKQNDLGIKEVSDTTVDDVEHVSEPSNHTEATEQGSTQLVPPEEQPGSSSTQENSTDDSGSVPASSEVQRLLDTLLNETPKSQSTSQLKRGKQQDLVKRHKCPECDKLFPRASSLKRHILLHMDDRPYQCTECDANYKSYSQLKRHLRIHTGEKPAKCEHCEKTFRTYNELYVHRRSHTGEKPFECKFCGKCFSTRGYRNTHERIHTGEKRFECDICGMKFTESSARRVHRFTHTGETPYKCEVCGRGFTQAGNLSKHVKTLHSKIKPFKCQECGKEFAVKQELTRHFSRVHSKDKPHQCKHCGKKYAIHSDLTQHMRTHKNRCSNCGIKFKNGEELQRHIMEDCLIPGSISPGDDSEEIERIDNSIDNGRQKAIEPMHSKYGNVGRKRTRKPHVAVKGAPLRKKSSKSVPPVNSELSSESEITINQESDHLSEEQYNREDDSRQTRESVNLNEQEVPCGDGDQIECEGKSPSAIPLNTTIITANEQESNSCQDQLLGSGALTPTSHATVNQEAKQ